MAEELKGFRRIVDDIVIYNKFKDIISHIAHMKTVTPTLLDKKISLNKEKFKFF